MIRIVTDSVASIPADVARGNDIEVVSLYLHRGGVEYVDAQMDVEAFYEDIYEMAGDIPTSSQPSQGLLERVFEAAAEAGDEMLGIFMSSKMSGTVAGAHRAARSVAARHAGFGFRIVDSLSNSFDEAFSVLAAASGRAAGCSLEQCVRLAEDSIARSRFLFTPESLRFLQAGGRIGNASALLGSLMKICPIITVADGETTTFAKVRTHRRALSEIASKFKADVRDCGLKNVVVHYIGDRAEASAWASEAVEPVCGREVPVIPVSPVIGSHVGPAVGIAYECERVLPGKLSPNVRVPVYAS